MTELRNEHRRSKEFSLMVGIVQVNVAQTSNENFSLRSKTDAVHKNSRNYLLLELHPQHNFGMLF